MEDTAINISDDLETVLQVVGIQINIPDKLESAFRREVCIYKVPSTIRNVRETAYTPRLVSIGLIHKDNRNESMELQKKIYLKEFYERFKTEVASDVFEGLVRIIREQKQNIINCYEDLDISGVRDDELEKMILLDAVFIMELFLRNTRREDYVDDSIIRIPRLRAAVRQDLLLFENQLPFSILDRLYGHSFSNFKDNNYTASFLALTCDYFSCCVLGIFSTGANIAGVNVLHFTDVVRRLWLIENRLVKARDEFILHVELFSFLKTYIPSATILHDKVGVEFESFSPFEPLLKVTFGDKKNFTFREKENFPWKGGKLIMSSIKIGDYTEVIIRNIMVLEICYYPSETFICSYCRLLDYLINTVEDVNLLIEAGIIFNHLGDNALIAKMINELCYEINEGVNCYNDVFMQLEKFYQSKGNRCWAPLKRVYFKDTWTSTATIVAAFVIVLQIAQTFSSIWQIAHVSK